MAEGPSKQRRTSLSKTQQASALGAELLALCQRVTSDGALDEAEAQQLEAWLRDHQDGDLPAIAYLRSALERILADRKITPDELNELHELIEAVLPPEVRGLSRAARRARTKRERESRRAEEQARVAAERAAVAKNLAIDHFDFIVAGVRYEGRAALVERDVRAGNRLYLWREPDNRFSRNAVAVLTEHGYQIGYVPEDHATDLAPLLDASHPYVASVKKLFEGERGVIPIVVADVFPVEADFEGLTRPGTELAKQPTTGPTAEAAGADRDSESGWRLPWRTALAIGAAVGLFMLLRGCASGVA